MIIATASDYSYIHKLISLIGSIHHHCGPIPIDCYDLGLGPDCRSAVSGIEGLTIRDVDLVNPQCLTRLRLHDLGNEDTVPGLYTWKIALIKQVLEHGDVMYLDAGTTVVRPLGPVFDTIRKEGCFLVKNGTIGHMATKAVRAVVCDDRAILDAPGVDAGVMGLRRDLYDMMALPLYELARDIELFRDDGSAEGGPTCGLAEQSLFSIMAAKNGLPLNCTDTVVHSRLAINDRTAIYHSRGDANYPLQKDWVIWRDRTVECLLPH